MFKKVLLIFIISAAAIKAQGENAPGKDTISTPEIVVESNRLKMTKYEAPNKIQVFDDKFILSLNSTRLADILEHGDAMFIKDYGFNSGIKTISLNSTQSEHTLVLLNGVRLNSTQNAQVDVSLYDLENVKRIEISKGGLSSLYGSEAIGGIINIVTGSNLTLKPVGVQVKSLFGSYGFRKFYSRFSHSPFKNKILSYNISFSDERAKNDFEYYSNGPVNETLKQRENADFNSQLFNFNLDLFTGKKNNIKIFTNYSHFERGVPGAEIGYSYSNARQIDYNSISSVTFSRQFSSRIRLNSGASYSYSLQKYYDPVTFNLPVVINSFYKLNSYAHTLTLNFESSKEFNVESGYELSYNNITSNETEEGRLFQGAVFAVSKYELSPGFISKVIFYPSIRYDYFSNINQKSVVTGKFGINIEPFKNVSLNIKSTVGNNFSAPTFNELYWKDLGNKDLKPERSVSFDAGLYFKINTLFANEIEFSYYNINTTDRIVWTPVSGSIWRPVNVGKVKSEGIDLSLNSGFVSARDIRISLKLSYSYGAALKKNEDFPGDPSYNKQLIYLPKGMLKSAFMFYYLPTTSALKYVSFGLFYKFTSRRYVNFENTIFARGFDVFDGNAGLGVNLFNLEVDLKFIVNNILNSDYQAVPAYPMPLRNYKVEIGFKY